MTTDGPSQPRDPTETIGRAAAALFACLAAVSAFVAPFRDEREMTTLLVNGALIVGLIGLRFIASLALPSRPLRVLGLMLFIAMVQPAALILATILEGDVTYVTATTLFSHHDGSVRVALATFALFAAATVGASIVGISDRKPSASFASMSTTLSDNELALLSWTGALVFAAQFVMLFVDPSSEAGGVVYGVRVIGHAMWPTTIYIGTAMRRGRSLAYRQFVFVAAASTLLIIAGNRGTPLSAFLCIAFGYVAAAPMPRRRLFMLGGGAAVVLMVGLVAGDVLRNDGGSRTSADAFRRIGELVSGQTRDVNAENVRVSALHRILRNSTHTVVTRIPQTMPYERDGIAKIPDDFANTFLPQVVRPTAYLETIRATFLREFGYVITENTAVEFAVIGDGWYRGGYSGVLVIGLLLGIFLQLGEAFSYRGSTVERCLKLAVVLGSTQVMEGRDIVFGMRKMIMGMAIITAALIALRLYRGRAGTAVAPLSREAS